MKKIRALYVEDNPQDAATLSRQICKALDRIPGKPETKLEIAVNVHDARTLLDTSAFDILFADLDFGDDRTGPRLLGKSLIKEMRRDCPNALIICISYTSEQERAWAREAGADVVLHKDTLWDDDDIADTIWKAVRKAASKHDRDEFVVGGFNLHHYEDSWPLASAIEEIGRNTLLFLMRQHEPSLNEGSLSLISGGFSGATLFCVTPGPYEQTRPFLLKVHRDRESLEVEAKRSAEVRRLPAFPPEFILPLDQDGSTDLPNYRGWYAVTSNFNSAWVTLSSWITRDYRADTVDRLAFILFRDQGMQSLSRSSEVISKRPSHAYLETLLKLGRRSRVYESAKELSGMLVSDDVLAQVQVAMPESFDRSLLVFHSTPVENFLAHGVVDGMSTLNVVGETVFYPAHGDLHSRNILVSDHSGNIIVKLIDFAHFGKLPRGADLARLTVDLFISCAYSGTRGHCWQFLPVWMLFCQSFLSFDAVEFQTLTSTLPCAADDHRTRNVFALLHWMMIHRDEIVPGMPHWEFSLALAIEFLRHTYFDNIPAPKRAFALLAGSLALRVCAATASGKSTAASAS